MTQEAAHVESCIFTLLCPQYAVYRIYACLLFPTQGVVNHLKENQQTAALSPIHCRKDIFCNIPVKKWSRFTCPSAETKNIKQQHSSHSVTIHLVWAMEPWWVLESLHRYLFPLLFPVMMPWLQSSIPLCFDWRANELSLNQTYPINLLHTTNNPYFTALHFLCTPEAIQTMIKAQPLFIYF